MTDPAGPAGSARRPRGVDGRQVGPAVPAGADAGVVQVAELVQDRPASLGTVRLVCVDGPAGSGKTTFAARLAAALGRCHLSAAIVHLDDLYEGWDGLEGVQPRLRSQVLEPLRHGQRARFQRYDWAAAAFDGWVDVPAADVLVVEGCGAGRRSVAVDACVRVWVEAAAELRLSRGLARDGQEARADWLRWMAQEDVHFAREGTRGRADVVLDEWGRMRP